MTLRKYISEVRRRAALVREIGEQVDALIDRGESVYFGGER